MHEFEKALLNYYSPEQLAAIFQKKIGIAGAGGLGSNIAVCLVRSGFVDFEIIDSDVIEMKNLNRQYYFLDEVGKPKVAVLTERLKQINPAVKVKSAKERITLANITNYFTDRDVVFEAFDNVESKTLLMEALANSGKLLVFGSGMAGISNQNELKINKLRENIFLVGDGITPVGKNNPPLAPRVVACAALMASVVLEDTLKGIN
ncbi:MAG: sulfur carrier protein ThiS adenylyltransferase ThiF [Candidatus Margulisiibacteriota bacterium]